MLIKPLPHVVQVHRAANLAQTKAARDRYDAHDAELRAASLGRAAKRLASVRRTALPKGVLWLVLSFWRSSRDAVRPGAGDRHAVSVGHMSIVCSNILHGGPLGPLAGAPGPVALL